MKSVITVLAFFAFISSSFAQPHVEQGGTNPPTPQEPPNGWYKQTSGTNQWLPKIFFINKDTGWVGGPEGLYWTTNGGSIWQLLTTKAVTDPHFIDGKNGWGITGNKTVGRSADGGKTWNDKNVGIVGGPGITTIEIFGIDTVYGLLSRHFVRSEDGGETWTDQGINLTSNDMAFIDSKTGYICGDPQGWFKDPPPPFGVEGAGFDYTTDGGKIWIPRFPFLEDTDDSLWIVERLRSIEATSINEVFVAGDTTIYKSNNAGQSWRSIFSNISVNDLFFITPELGYAVGYPGKIYFTNDAGRTWSEQVSTVSDDLRNVIFIDSLAGWACGDLGTIIHTTDGGKLWVRQYLPFDSIVVQTYPEPAQNITNVHYTIPSPQHVTIRVFDPSGREVSTPYLNIFQSQGEHTIPVNLMLLPPGAYYIRFETEKYRSTVRVTVVR